MGYSRDQCGFNSPILEQNNFDPILSIVNGDDDNDSNNILITRLLEWQISALFLTGE